MRVPRHERTASRERHRRRPRARADATPLRDAMTATGDTDGSVTRVVRHGPRLPLGARVRCKRLFIETKASDHDAPLEDHEEDFSCPRLDDEVTLRVRGWRLRQIIDDDVIRHDRFTPARESTFVVDDARTDASSSEVCVGFEAAALTMFVGEVCGVVVPSGRGECFEKDPIESVPRDCYVEWEIDLAKIRRKERLDALASARRVLDANAVVREEANALFSRGEYSRALRRYDECATELSRVLFQAAQITDEEMYAVAKMAVTVNTNAATALAKLGRQTEVLMRCDAALEIDRTAVKAMYRKAIALESLERDDEALSCLRDALELSKDKAIREAFVRVRRRIETTRSVESKTERERCVRMMKATSEEDTTSAVQTTFVGRMTSFCRRRPFLSTTIVLAVCTVAVMCFEEADNEGADNKLE